MSTEDEMTIDERRKYLGRMKKPYSQGSRNERGHLLDEMEAVTELHRKSLIRLMNGGLKRTPRRQQRGRTYGPEVDDALRVIAESADRLHRFDYVCPERLTPNLVWMARHLATHGELRLSPTLLQQLDHISVSTVQRILARVRQDEPRLPRKGPEGANRATRGVPMKRIPWNETQPGHPSSSSGCDFEVDLVHHSGPNPSGQYLHTLQMIDVATGWSERVAVLGRSYLVMQDGFRRALARLPFPLLGIHPDNGSEFFNHHLLRFWGQVADHIELSRSRPSHKHVLSEAEGNDNPFVEQKNATLVRAYVGHERLDTVAQTLALNQLYEKMWLYYNFFQPVLRQVERSAAAGPDGIIRIRRKQDRARTPLQRLIEAEPPISRETRERLLDLRRQTNPLALKRSIHAQLRALFALAAKSEKEKADPV